MTASLMDNLPAGDDVRRAAIAQLARTETGRMLARASIWFGLAGTLALVVTSAGAEEEWSGQKYTALVPLSILPMMIGTFVAGIRSGNRDRSHDRPSVAEDAPLDGDQRVLARLASLIVPLGVTALLMLIIGVASRIEGGFWVGDPPNRTYSAVHSVFELLQPVLVVAVIGAAGVATGRAVRRSGPAIVIGVTVLFFSGAAYWIWNLEYVYATALMQIQPLEFDTTELVHTPTVIFHDLYLLGLVSVFSGLCFRHILRRRLVVGGVVVSLVSVAVQLAMSPF